MTLTAEYYQQCCYLILLPMQAAIFSFLCEQLSVKLGNRTQSMRPFPETSLRDYPCRRPARVVSWAAQAATVVPPVRRHGKMLRLINRREFCLNIPP